MNKTVYDLIQPKAGAYLTKLQDKLLLIKEMQRQWKILQPLVHDIRTVKNLANTVFTLCTQDINKMMKLGGWEGLIGGSDLNEELHGLLRNPAIILYTQILTGLVVALTASEELREPDCPQEPSLPEP